MRFLSRVPILISCLTLQAALIPAFSLEDLSTQSSVIVEGVVTSSAPGWDAKHTFVWTHYQVQVQDWIRGPGGRSVEVSEPGGTMDGDTYQGSGTVQYAIGEHVLLFLYKTPIGFMRATGAGQGKLTITPQGNIRLNLGGLEFAGSAGPAGTSPSTLAGKPLAAVKSAIRTISASHPQKAGVR